MATLADSLVSTTSRTLSLRMRPDLSARRHRYHGETYWVVKEPIGLNYFRFHEEEYAILLMLDGESSLDQIKERFEEEFTPQKITFQDLQQFIGMLHRSGLVISNSAGQGRQLKKRRVEKKRRELLGKLTNVFAVRWRGIDPEWILTHMYRYTRWIFHPVCVFFCIALACSALMLVLVQFEVFQSKLPTFHQFFGKHNWIYLGVTMAVVKVIHEFGHGLSCKHFGGECHEMGFMLLVFTPCLYCNVSDSWMLPNKWHRVIIGAGGMYIEVVMASAATFVWWFSEEGLLNQLALSMMFICSVSTIVFNGNPLLRFDGYYILMDISEIPNLRQKSTEILKRFMTELCLGIEQPENPFLPQGNRLLFGLYTIAAVVYRWVVVLSILMFMNKVLEPYGLKVVGQVIALVGLFGLVVQPLWKLGKFFYTPGSMHKVKKHRLIATAAVVGTVIAAVVFIPLPHSVICTFDIGPRDAASVYVDVPGLAETVHVKPGQTVAAGDPILTLSNPNQELTVLKLEGEKQKTLTLLRTMRQQRYHEESRGLRIDEYQENLVNISQQLKEQTAELARLRIMAPVAGTIIPPPSRQPKKSQDGTLPAWTGTPLEKKNRGAMLTERDLVCKIGDPADLEALLIIDQGDIELVDEMVVQGDWPKVTLKPDAYPYTSIDGAIVEIAKVEMKAAPSSLSSRAGGELDTVVDETGVAKPLSTSYHARVPLVDAGELAGVLRPGMRGTAKVHTKPRSLGDRMYRYLARTFNFEL